MLPAKNTRWNRFLGAVECALAPPPPRRVEETAPIAAPAQATDRDLFRRMLMGKILRREVITIAELRLLLKIETASRAGFVPVYCKSKRRTMLDRLADSFLKTRF